MVGLLFAVSRCMSKISRASVTLDVRPLTPSLWPALADLFGEKGACSGCWCMYWRIGSAYRHKPSSENKAAFQKIVKRGPPPGLVAFHGRIPVGWCQLTPRDSLPWLDRTWRLKRVDDLTVWCISCFYVRKGYRKRGITSALIAAAVDRAKRAGAPAVEAYPLDASATPSASGTGYASTFARAGFQVVCLRTLARPIMRYEIRR